MCSRASLLPDIMITSQGWKHVKLQSEVELRVSHAVVVTSTLPRRERRRAHLRTRRTSRLLEARALPLLVQNISSLLFMSPRPSPIAVDGRLGHATTTHPIYPCRRLVCQPTSSLTSPSPDIGLPTSTHKSYPANHHQLTPSPPPSATTTFLWHCRLANFGSSPPFWVAHFRKPQLSHVHRCIDPVHKTSRLSRITSKTNANEFAQYAIQHRQCSIS